LKLGLAYPGALRQQQCQRENQQDQQSDPGTWADQPPQQTLMDQRYQVGSCQVVQKQISGARNLCDQAA
jgi:hypothetical protein